jgi:hypothetical protein
MVAYVIDTPRCLGPQTFMTNMLQVGWIGWRREGTGAAWVMMGGLGMLLGPVTAGREEREAGTLAGTR